MTTADQTFIGLPFKYVSLISLTLQNSLLAILLTNDPQHQVYSASAAVLLNEILKCSISFLVALSSHHDHEIDSPFSSAPKISVSPFEQDFQNWKLNSRSYSRMIIDHSKQILIEIISTDCWKLSIPAVLYVIQNNLQFVAAANLDVATFSILTTALCSVVMLGRQLSVKKWTALFFLAVGVALVQLQNITTTTTEPIKGFRDFFIDHLSTLAGVFIFGTPLPLGSAAGSLVVLAATFAYNSSDDPHSNLRPSNSISFPLVKGPTGFISPLPREKQRTL
ncbi:hypothetical protein H4Q26_006496 [Puccinia striiformis f. sp. tritici PST-130]|nr:hypothetical protein H4Q26_006496 [Puccinia striiformis f. sp. tritici PST-130]